jgi:aerobic-type carbon monoxide dehydrogenase small subunit (CoxS/CutS family)
VNTRPRRDRPSLAEASSPGAISFTLNGELVYVEDGISLLDVLREELECRSVKDGCSPQGQCGCCTVWVDDAPRVACVTPVRRIAGRAVTTLEGLPAELRDRWAAAFVATGASQCGFCTPGILMRLAALEECGRQRTRGDVEAALRAHLCRCTGWQSIVEAACLALRIPGDAAGSDTGSDPGPDPGDVDAVGRRHAPPRTRTTRDGGRDPVLAAWRAQVEGISVQSSGRVVVLGGGGFADDGSPTDALLRLGVDAPLASGFRAARAGAGRVQGRNSTVPLSHPVEVPTGTWALTLQTTWVEPAYVEPDASWSRPGGEAASPLANGGAFGGKRDSAVAASARALADGEGVPVRVLWRREDVVRRGPKRPPLAVALRSDGSGVLRVGRTPGSAELTPLIARLRQLAPEVDVEVVDVAGPPVSPALRGSVWAELVAARSVVDRWAAEPSPPGSGRAHVAVPGAGRARVELHFGEGERGRLRAEVWAGEVLDRVTLRSYVIGAVHQALGLVLSEGIAVDPAGDPLDLSIRSFGILAARDMPEVVVTLHEEQGWPVNGSDAVFAATLAAAWMAEGLPPRWPTRRAALRAPRRDVAPFGGRKEPM